MDLGQQGSSCGSMQSVELICTNGNRTELDHPNIDSCCASVMVNSRADSKTEAEETAAAAIDCPKNFHWDLFQYDMANNGDIDTSTGSLRTQKLQQ